MASSFAIQCSIEQLALLHSILFIMKFWRFFARSRTPLRRSRRHAKRDSLEHLEDGGHGSESSEKHKPEADSQVLFKVFYVSLGGYLIGNSAADGGYHGFGALKVFDGLASVKYE